MLHSAPDAPIWGVFLSYSLRCLRCSSPWHQVLPRTIQSGGLGRAPLRPGCSNPGSVFVVFSPLPRKLQSVAPGSPPDDPVRGLGLSSTLPRMLQSGASCILLSLLSSAFACVVHWCFFFFARPSSLLYPRSPRSASLSSPPFPLTLRPRLPRSRFSLPLLPPPPFVVALLGHALKHLVSTRACCYFYGRAHTFILLLSLLPSLCSRALFLFSSLPLWHALCVAFAYFVASPLLFVWGKHASSYSYACSLPPSSSHSFCRTLTLTLFVFCDAQE